MGDYVVSGRYARLSHPARLWALRLALPKSPWYWVLILPAALGGCFLLRALPMVGLLFIVLGVVPPLFRYLMYSTRYINLEQIQYDQQDKVLFVYDFKEPGGFLALIKAIWSGRWLEKKSLPVSDFDSAEQRGAVGFTWFQISSSRGDADAFPEIRVGGNADELEKVLRALSTAAKNSPGDLADILARYLIDQGFFEVAEEE